ncbi:peptidoglycan recognition family protein [Amycolatopsis sp., V23-08]|uniref:Peptidoglycan recognition family protein n=1 Tax=Amycolatopsis heterodermiae TaxID=3110235 RepID=A0ABU5QZ49_9PSEU|nr:peptidoglycan recognition family protein [Amycolatopsis sp., V23-08]MEA5359197.1 peptidoglycan recognition family protein [Amycolatopsis sp., V23-08]
MADFDRRALLKAGFTATAVGTLGLTGVRTAAAAVPTPTIHSTSEWGARAATGPIVVENHKPTYIVVHHAVDPPMNDDFSLARAFYVAKYIQDLHMDKNGWIDSGQQFTNSRGGFVTEGRHRSLEILRGGTQHVQGANVGNHNSEVIGIENEGLYSTVDVPQALWDSLVNLVAYIAHQYGIAPEFIKGHRDFNTTECPGQVLYNRLPELRTAVGRVLGVPVARAEAEWPLLKPGDTGKQVQLAQRFLRTSGADVPADGVFGKSTKDAVAALAARAGLPRDTCTASKAADETGFLGSDVWPLIVPADRSTAAWRADLSRA